MEKKTLTLKEIAKLTNATLIGNPDLIISDVADLESATPSDISFLSNPRYEKAMEKSKAGAIFINAASTLSANKNFLLHENPSQAFQILVDFFHGNCELTGFEGIHPTAVIHPSCKIGAKVTIGPHTVIDKEAVIEDGCFIGAGCYIGPYVLIQAQTILHPHVTIRERCRIGKRVILQPGVVIGSCGFGYISSKEGKHTKLNQVGIVVIEDDVEIGANTTIDRARFKCTLICKGTKIDNLVQIAHGVTIGEDNILAAQTGVAGSTSTGRCVIAGGQVAIAGHISLADGVILAGRSGVSKSLTEAGKYNGAPAMPLQDYNRNSVYLRNIEEHLKRLESLLKQDKNN